MTEAASETAGLAITAIETVRVEEHSNVLWVLVETNEGLTGLGETFFMPAAVESYIHEWAAPRLLGRDPLRIDRIARDLQPYIGLRSASAEMRGNSAIDIALWDVFGKASGLPVVQLLGGKVREDIATYNTCAGTEYMRRAEGQSSRNWSLGATRDYDDLNAFLTRADELVEEGYPAMKIWPFDMAAERNAGLRIDAAELKAALDPFERIRRAVGDGIDVMVEFHSLWSLPAALKITRALEPYGTFWHEDPMRMDSLTTLRRYADVSKTPVCASELLYGRAGFKDLFEAEVAGFATLDLSWCGGISEARKIAAMAEAWQLPVAPHDCTGPILLCASTHVALHATNAVFQESVRAFHRTWYADAVTHLPPIAKGRITVPPGPGLGTELHPDLDRRFTISRRRSGRGA